MEDWQILAIDTNWTGNVEIGKEAVDVTSDAVLLCRDTVKTKNWNSRVSDIESDTIVCLFLDMIDFYLLKDFKKTKMLKINIQDIF